MGILCQINLFRPLDGVYYYHSKEEVSGVIKYAIDYEPKEVSKITISLKGIGKIKLTRQDKNRTYRCTETYVDKDTVILNKRTIFPVGSYEVKFSFFLPPNIPSSLRCKKQFKDYLVKCDIVYYIRIKFEKPGLFSGNKHFRKEINVMSQIVQKLLTQPMMYERRKKVFQICPFSKKDSFIIISATVQNSALPWHCNGGKIAVQYTVVNESHVTIEMIKSKLVEVYKFEADGYRRVTYKEDVRFTRGGDVVCLNSGETRHGSLEFNITHHLYSLENTKIVTRYYFIRISATLPMLHRDAVLEIPIQIGVFKQMAELNPAPSATYGNSSPSVTSNNSSPSLSIRNPSSVPSYDDPPPYEPPSLVNFDEPPPSYWEVMHEMNDNEDFYDN